MDDESSATDRASWGGGPNDLWLVGPDAILQCDSSTWTSVASGTEESLAGVWCSGPNDLWAVGAYGTILERPRPLGAMMEAEEELMQVKAAVLPS